MDGEHGERREKKKTYEEKTRSVRFNHAADDLVELSDSIQINPTNCQSCGRRQITNAIEYRYTLDIVKQ